MQSDTLKWVVQLPRLYHVFKENQDVNTFQDVLDSNYCFSHSVLYSHHICRYLLAAF
jgi:hypothetical protein